MVCMCFFWSRVQREYQRIGSVHVISFVCHCVNETTGHPLVQMTSLQNARCITHTPHRRFGLLVILLHLRLFFRNPLFSPCKCSGSIGLVHQDCLVSWLEVTRGDGTCITLCLQHDCNSGTSGTVAQNFVVVFELLNLSHLLAFHVAYLSLFCLSLLQADVNFVTQNFALILNMPTILPIDCRPMR